MLRIVKDGHRLEDVNAVDSRKTAAVGILDPLQTIPECLLHAMEREFPWISIDHAASAEALCRAFGTPIRLVLVAWDCLDEVSEVADRIREKHPGSIVAAIHDEKSGQISPVLSSGTVRSVLPMDLRLDIWLSVVRLMLLGAEYFPLSVLQTAEAAPSAAESNRPLVINGRALTRRENEVIALLSRGLQNKHIAAELGVSEHTVKIHLHNIIAKLGAANRTAAAAIYLESGNSRQSPTATDTVRASVSGGPSHAAVP